MVVDQVLVELVGCDKAQLTLRALAHAATVAALLAAVLVGALPAAAKGPDPMRPQQWHLDTVHAEDAWRAHRGGGITVAVVDTGVDASHPDLAGRVRGGIDLVDEGTAPDDPNGHGTLVAGALAAVAGNGIGVAGAAPEVTVMPVRVLDAKGEGDANRVARGVRWAADNGAQVINLSLAEVPGLLSDLAGLMGSELENAIRYAAQRGALVVAAAGNDGHSSTPYHADLPVVVVGATDRDDRVWPASNRDSRTLFAPGVDILATWRGHGYGKGTGTSFAAPIVAAGAAILRGQGLDAEQARSRLESTAVRTGSGRGRVDLAAAAGVEPQTGGSPPSPTPTATPMPTPSPSAVATGTPPTDAASPGSPPDAATTAPTAPAVAGVEPVPTTQPESGSGSGSGEIEGIAEQEPDGDQRSPSPPIAWAGWALLVGVAALFARAALRR